MNPETLLIHQHPISDRMVSYELLNRFPSGTKILKTRGRETSKMGPTCWQSEIFDWTAKSLINKKWFLYKGFFRGRKFYALRISRFSFMKSQKVLRSEGKNFTKNFKGLLAFFPFKIFNFCKGIFRNFPIFFVKEFSEFFPLNFEFFQCFCKGIFGIFPFKFSIFPMFL